MDSSTKYVTFGVPDFEKVQEKKSVFRNILSIFKNSPHATQDVKNKLTAPSTSHVDLEPKNNPSVQRVDSEETPIAVNSEVDAARSHTSMEQNFVPSSHVHRTHNDLDLMSQPSPIAMLGVGASSHWASTSLRRLYLPFNLPNPSTSGMREEPTDRRYWMLDENCRQCFECGVRFTAIRRKHHCRVCGRIFCYQCSDQFVEGHQIGMSGLQRVCNFCAFSLSPTPTNASTSSSLVSRPGITTRTNRPGFRSTVDPSQNTRRAPNNDSTPFADTTPVGSLRSTNPYHLSRSATPLSSSNTTPSDGTGMVLRTRGTLRAPASRTNSDVLAVDVDAFPAFCPMLQTDTSDGTVNYRVRPTTAPASSSPALSGRTPRNLSSPVTNLSVDRALPLYIPPPSPSLLTSPSSSCRRVHAPTGSNENTMRRLWTCSDAIGHKYDQLTNDAHIRILWSRMLDSCAVQSENFDGRPDTVELTGLNGTSKELQLLTVVHGRRNVYCASGLGLVYWLTSNVTKVGQCRSKARSICQRFLDLSLMAPLNGEQLNEFRDDFTPYELKQLEPCSEDTNQRSDRRVSWPLDISFKSFADEQQPDWLQEIVQNNVDAFGSRRVRELERLLSDDGEVTPDTISLLDHPERGLRTGGSTGANLSASIDLGITSLLPSAKSQTFEIGEDVRPATGPTSPIESTTSPSSTGVAMQHGGSVVSSMGSMPDLRTSIVPRCTAKPEVQSLTRDAAIMDKQRSKEVQLFSRLPLTFETHLHRLVLQETRDNQLSSDWAPRLLHLARMVCEVVRFDLRTPGQRTFAQDPTATTNSGEANADRRAGGQRQAAVTSQRKTYSPMDIRHYVHMKKLVDDQFDCESEIFPGIIFTKRATHKFMPRQLRSPRILLLASCMDYQRTVTKMTWLESQIMQEEEYLSNCVSKLLRLRPHVIVIGGSVSHVAQTLLLKAGITLFCNVKWSVLVRLARITGADILESVDRLISDVSTKSSHVSRSSTQLGVSEELRMEQVHGPDGCTQFLTFVKNANQSVCPSESHNNTRYRTAEATVLLRGPDLDVLRRAKRCLRFILCACYNARSELSYLANGFIYQTPHTHTGQTHDTISEVLDNKLEQAPNTRLPPTSDLAAYIDGRSFSLSPSVDMKMPFLASESGLSAPLAAYYTYVMEWPLGRRLNDTLKQRLKAIRSKLYAMRRVEEKRRSKIHPNCLAELPSMENKHEFLMHKLKFQSTHRIQTWLHNPTNRLHLQTHRALDDVTSMHSLLIAELFNPVDQYIWLDFKSRAFISVLDGSMKPKMITSLHKEELTSAEYGEKVDKFWFSRFSVGCTELLRNNHSDVVLDLRERLLGSKVQSKIPTGKSVGKPPGVTNGSKDAQVKRLTRSIHDPRSHQFFSFITALYSPKSPMWPEPCVPPWIATVGFYGTQDLPLGLFLEKCCFMQQSCRHPHCDRPMTEHVQRFVQTAGSVELSVRKLPHEPVVSSAASTTFKNLLATCSGGSVGGSTCSSLPNRPDSRLLTWLYCPVCRTNSPTIHMAGDSWHYSFVKFLDLLINSPREWVRCAMQSPTVATGVQKVNDATQLSSISTSSSSTAPDSTVITDIAKMDTSPQNAVPLVNNNRAPVYQLACPHSASQSLQHCFAFERKVAVFKYQPTTVFEVFMPPNEIRICPGLQMASATRLMSAAGPVTQTNTVKHGPPHGIGQQLASDPASSIPTYLYQEAVETWRNYYHVCTSVKAHLITLRDDNMNPEMTILLEGFVQHLERDSKRGYMELRAELLAHLINPGSNSCSEPPPPSLDPRQKCLPLDAVVLARSIEHSAEYQTGDSFSLDASPTHRIDELDETAVSPAAPPLFRMRSSPMPLLPTLSTPPTGVDAELPSNEREDGCCNWDALLDCPLDGMEQTAIIQTLINELKRYIYDFVSEWNTRCSDYEIQVRKATKTAKEAKKKLSLAGLPSPSASRSSRLWASAATSESLTPYPPTEGPTTSTVMMLDDVNDAIGLPPLPPSHQLGIRRNMSATSALRSTRRVGDDSDSQVPHLIISDPLNSMTSTDMDGGDVMMSETTETPSSMFALGDTFDMNLLHADLADGPATLNTTIELSEQDATDSVNGENRKRRTPGTSPSRSRSISSHLTDLTGVPATVSAAPLAVRRFIHTLIPSAGSMDNKVFDLPLAPSDHPQLRLWDEVVGEVGDVSVPRNACTLMMQQAERHRVLPRSAEYLVNFTQHLRLLLPDVYVSEQELTSIVAYALSTSDYEKRLADLCVEPGIRNSANTSMQMGQSVLSEFAVSSGEFMSSQTSLTHDLSVGRSSKTARDLDPVNQSRSFTSSNRSGEFKPPIDDVFMRPSPSPSTTRQTNTLPAATPSATGAGTNVHAADKGLGNRHIKMQFSDSTTNFYCCAYYASEFRKLRQLVLPQGEAAFIRSLSRCFQWDARGGKSGSQFLKTCDERFVVKELSAIELKTFHEISRQYFDYLVGAALEQRLCVLTRILGIFHVGFKNSLSGEMHQYHVFVTENLFHDRLQLVCIYDLKGALRKRLVDETATDGPSGIGASGGGGLLFASANAPDGYKERIAVDGTEEIDGTGACAPREVPVLLDQNLLNASVDSPLYLRVHSKNALSHCLQVDTEFLANLFIMDYSLLVGVDTSTNQLVIGLIDYLRKFTFDKRMEMMFKQTITSAQAPPPTILTPDLYRERFLVQMDQYFPLVPDLWYDSLAEHAEAWRVRRVSPEGAGLAASLQTGHHRGSVVG